MRLKYITIVFSMVLLPAMQVTAADTNVKDEIPYSYYLIPCSNYVDHRSSGMLTDANNSADMFYVAGWLSAYNRLKADSGVPDDTKLEDVMQWLEGYCKDHGQSDLQTGLFAFGDTVSKKISTPLPPTVPLTPSPVLSPAKPESNGLKPLRY